MANDRYAWYLVKSEVTRKPENVSEGDDKSFDVTVYGIRGAGGEGSTFELKLVGSGCDTTWTYEWKKMESN